MKDNVDEVLTACADRVDRQWASACRKIEQAWRVEGGSLRSKPLPTPVQSELDSLIVNEMRRVRVTAYPLTSRPSLAGTGMSIGRAALDLIPLARFGPKVYLPAAIVASFAYLWQFIWGQVVHRERVYRQAVSEQLSLLSERIATQCELTLRERIVQLQEWRNAAIERMTREIARNQIPLVV